MASKKSFSVVDMTGGRIQPPGFLNKDQLAEWHAIVDSMPADYFRPSDITLLAAYCVASSFYKAAAEDIAKRGMVLRDSRDREYANPVHMMLTSQAASLAQLAVKLRLCPSTRYGAKAGASRGATGGTKPRRPWDKDGEAAEG